MVTRLFLSFTMKSIKFLVLALVLASFYSCSSLMDIASALAELPDTSSSSSTSSYTNSYSSNTPSSASYQSSSSTTTTTPKKTRVKVECWACKGTGKSVSRTYPATYGVEANEAKREYCKYCGKRDRPHTHKNCTACKGLGYTYEYK